MEKLLKDTKEYVFTLLQEQLPEHILYHNYLHTLRVVDKVDELVKGEKIADKEADLLRLAAWFHDTGFIETVEGHEEKSIAIAKAFLNGKVSDEDFKQIEQLILSTKLSVTPKTHLEKIINDADFAHLASKNFDEINALLREEWRATNNMEVSDLEWKTQNISFLKKHRYQTHYAIEHWQRKKQNNLLDAIKSVKKLEKDQKSENQKSAAAKAKEAKANLPERGIETMFRVTLRNHINLSGIADTKANILLSVNAILISIALSNLVPRLDNPSNAHLILPTVILIGFSVISMIFAIQSTRPKVTEGRFSKEDVNQKKVNLLFFGNFHQMSLDEFQWGMTELMKDRHFLYDSMVKDLYFLGLVLHKKYRLLRITYTVFTIGIIISVLAFYLTFQTQAS